MILTISLKKKKLYSGNYHLPLDFIEYFRIDSLFGGRHL